MPLTPADLTDALRTVTAHLIETERIVDRYTAAVARIKVNGYDDIEIDTLRREVDDAVLMVVTEWETIGRPDELLERIHALPGAHQATIEAHVDPDSVAAFAEIVDGDTWAPTPLDAHATPPPFFPQVSRSTRPPILPLAEATSSAAPTFPPMR